MRPQTKVQCVNESLLPRGVFNIDWMNVRKCDLEQDASYARGKNRKYELQTYNTSFMSCKCL